MRARATGHVHNHVRDGLADEEVDGRGLVFESMIEMFTGLDAWILAFAASAWVYPVLFVLTTVDGFFPPIPSESAVIALAVAALAPGGPNLILIILVAAAGAWCGDQIAYQIGRMIGTERVRFLQSARGKRMVAKARVTLLHRGAAFILAARYIPVGRVAVNMTAGALHYPRRRFMAVTVIAAIMWAIYQSAIGIVAARWLADSVLLASVIGIVLGLVLGFVIDRVMTRFTERRAAQVAGSGAAPEHARSLPDESGEGRGTDPSGVTPTDADTLGAGPGATTCVDAPVGSSDPHPY